MVLATWNLMHAESVHRRKLLREHTDRVDADVWILTETHDAFSPGLPYRHSSLAVADERHHPDCRWVTIWSRYELDPLKASDAERTAAVRISPGFGPPIIVLGTVLPWLGSAWRGHPARGGVAFREALRVQMSDLRRMAADHPDHDLFMAGDFNQDLVSPPYYGSRANRTELEGALASANLVPLTAGSRDPIRRLSPPCACIDHICASSTARWRASAPFRWPDRPLPDRRLSDHFGVGVRLEC